MFGTILVSRSLRISRALEVARFVMTGTLSVIMNLAVIVFLTEKVGLNYLVSIAICFVTVTFVSFWLNRVWTFRKRTGAARIDFVRYLVTTIIQLLLCLLLCSICVNVFHIPYEAAVVGLSVAFVPLTYLLHRRWSFNLKWLQQQT